MTTQQVALVKPEDIPDIWYSIKPLFEEALNHSAGECLPAHLLQDLLNEREFLWIGIDEGEIKSALVASPIKYPRRNTLRILTWTVDKSSDFDMWYKHLHLIEEFGRKLGCTHVEAWVRKGLVKKLNWEHEYSIISKPIKTKQPRKRRRRTKTNG
jgi:hypothetical protein